MSKMWHYQKLKNKQLIAIPLLVGALFLASTLILGVTLGRELNGGSLISVRGLQNLPNLDEVKSKVTSALGKDVDIFPVDNGFHIETDVLTGNEENNVKDLLSGQFGIPRDSISIEVLGPVIKLSTLEILYCLIAVFAVICVITLIIFRRRIVPIAIMLVIALNLICLLGCMSLLRIPLCSASMLAIVVIIIYAVNTNILLAYHTLKGTETGAREQAGASMTVGMTSALILIIIFLSLNFLSTLPQMWLFATVGSIGVLINVFNTWFLSAGLFLRAAERKPGKEYHVGL